MWVIPRQLTQFFGLGQEFAQKLSFIVSWSNMKKMGQKWCIPPFWLSNTVFFANCPFFNRIELFQKQKLSYKICIGIFINSKHLGDFLNIGGILGNLSLFPKIFFDAISKFCFFYSISNQMVKKYELYKSSDLP